jgi:hypothetical protein
MDGGYPWKVNHQSVPNDAVKGMVSDCKQPVFRAGGNQVPYYLDIKGNYKSPVGLPVFPKTPVEKALAQQAKKLNEDIRPSYLFAYF